MSNLPGTYPQSVDKHWSHLKSPVITTCLESFSVKPCKFQDWFNENDNTITKLTMDTRKALRDHLNDPWNETKKEKHRELEAKLQTRTQDLKNQWWVNKSHKIQSLADCNNTQDFLQGTKAIFGLSHQGPVPLHTRDGSILLKDQKEINARLKEHFEELLNSYTNPNFEAIDLIPPHSSKDSLGAIPSLLKSKPQFSS